MVIGFLSSTREVIIIIGCSVFKVGFVLEERVELSNLMRTLTFDSGIRVIVV